MGAGGQDGVARRTTATDKRTGVHEHWKSEPLSEEANSKLASVALTVPDGPRVIVVCGGGGGGGGSGTLFRADEEAALRTALDASEVSVS